MHKLAVAALTLGSAVIVLNSGASLASGGSGGGGGTTTTSGAWPSAYPLPGGTVTAQSATRATVRSTDTVATVMARLDALYAQKGCTEHVAVNKPADYFCVNPVTRKTDEV